MDSVFGATDPQPIEWSLAQFEWVRRLARRLVLDADDADDVAQQTIVEALARPPHEPRNLRGWLSAVTRSKAAGHARGEQRRHRRELTLAARAEDRATPDALAAEGELQRELVTQLLALPPIYRDVLLLRFFRDRSPREIARELHLPLATVKTRQQRALALLRHELDRQHGDRQTWCAALAPLALRTAAIGSARLLLVGAVLLLATGLITTFVVPLLRPPPRFVGTAEPPAATASVDRQASVDDTDVAAAPVRERAAEPPIARDEVVRPGAAPAPRHTIRGRVIDLAGEPCPGLRVRFDDPRALRFADAGETLIVGEGFWLEITAEERQRLCANPAELAAWAQRNCSDPQAGIALLTGRPAPVIDALTTHAGGFTLDVPSTRRGVNLIDPHKLLLATGEDDAIDELLLVVTDAAPMGGQLIDAAGTPLGGGEVGVELRRDALPMPPGVSAAVWQRLRWTSLSATTADAAGWFRLALVPRHAHLNVTVVRDLAQVFAIDDEPRLDHRFTLLAIDRARFVITGQVTLADGSGSPRTTVLLGLQRATTDRHGWFQLEGDDMAFLPADDLIAARPGFAPCVIHGFGATLDAEHPQVTAPRLVLGGATLAITGRIVDAAGRGRAGLEVRVLEGMRLRSRSDSLEDLLGGGGIAPRLSDVDGRFRIDGLLAHPYTLSVSSGDARIASPPIDPGGAPIELVFP